MNYLYYKFSRETDSDLLNFIKTAKEQKLPEKCDLDQYEEWKKLLVDPNLIINWNDDEKISAPSAIDLCSESEDEAPTANVQEPEETFADQLDKGDMAFVIKENLQTHNDLLPTTKDYIHNCDQGNLKVLFETLECTLINEEIYYLGVALQDVASNQLVTLFCHCLLLPRIRREFCENLHKSLNEFSEKHTSLLIEECSLILQNLFDQEIPIVLQYLKRLNMKFQSTLIRNYILAINKLDDSCLEIIGSLINDDIEYEVLNKFVEMLSSIAEGYSKDKNFGKLLVTVVEALGPNLVHVEQPLKHIISGHKSIWKSKLEKKFATCYEDSLWFSQSFRD